MTVPIPLNADEVTVWVSEVWESSNTMTTRCDTRCPMPDLAAERRLTTTAIAIITGAPSRLDQAATPRIWLVFSAPVPDRQPLFGKTDATARSGKGF